MVGDVTGWLMDGDPAIRWQVQRALLGRAESTWRRERARVATSGWGSRLLAMQDSDGGWSGAVYSPKWTSTHYTLLQLVRMGLPPQHNAGRRGIERLLTAARYESGAVNLAKTVPPDECVNGMVLLMACYFGVRGDIPDGIAAWLLTQQMHDGGWNCEARRGATHSSFHTTVSTLEGLLAYKRATTSSSLVPEIESSLVAGQEFLLAHHLYRSHRTGAVADPAFTRFSFPPRWHYDVLRGLEHFAEAGAESDSRLHDPVDLLIGKRRTDGTWPLQNPHSGRVHFKMERAGRPSRWNTLRALRVLRWWEAAASPSETD